MSFEEYTIFEAENKTGRIIFSKENNTFYFFTNDEIYYKLNGTYNESDGTYKLFCNNNISGSFETKETAYTFFIDYQSGNYYREGTFLREIKDIIIQTPEGLDCDDLTDEELKNFDPKLSKSFCMAPWVHLYMQSSGMVFPCCKAKKSLLGNLNQQTFFEIWNSAKLKKIRKNMIKGKSIPSCEFCDISEKRWGESYRTFFNNFFAHHNIDVKNTNKDGSLDKLKLGYADLRISNLCNLKCRTCSSHSSSAWYEDEKKLGWNTSKVKVYNLWKSLKEQIPEILDTVERINFAGGEPLLIEEQYEIIDELIKRKKTDIYLTYNTNFTNLNYKNYNILSKWKLFKNLTIKASLDGIKERGEYIRHGLKWDEFLNNRFLLHRHAPHAVFKIFVTVQVFNVLHLPEMYEYLLKYKFIDNNIASFHLSFLTEPKIYDIRSLPDNMKQKVSNTYNSFFEKHHNNEKLIKHFSKVLTVLYDRSYDVKELFKTTTLQLDNIRKENAVSIFPELNEYFKECKII